MAVSAKELRLRMRTVGNLQKITRAMEMVAATKLRRLQDRAQGARPYADSIRRFSTFLAANPDAIPSPLVQSREKVDKVGVLVISSDRGLCGSYNTNVFRALIRHMEENPGPEVDLYLLGKKARGWKKGRHHVRETFEDEVEKLDYRRARDLAHALSRDFIRGSADGGVDEVWLNYTRFVSVGKQVPVVEKLLPIESDEAEGDGEGAGAEQDILLEPSAEALLEHLLPKSLSIAVFASILDALASEFAARRAAMKAATDAAGDMITSLRRIYNRVRQEAITKELLDIVGGAEALK